MTNDELIRRARELAALAGKATPGPWNRDMPTKFSVGGTAERILVVTANIETLTSNVKTVAEIPDVGDNAIGNMNIIAAAPEMAALLEQLADCLEKLESWARPMLEQYGTELARIGEK